MANWIDRVGVRRAGGAPDVQRAAGGPEVQPAGGTPSWYAVGTWVAYGVAAHSWCDNQFRRTLVTRALAA